MNGYFGHFFLSRMLISRIHLNFRYKIAKRLYIIETRTLMEIRDNNCIAATHPAQNVIRP